MTGAPSTVAIAAAARPRTSVTRVVLGNPLGRTALIVLAFVVLLSIVGPFLMANSPTAVRLDMILAPPGSDYLLGGDSVGRDILSRLVSGGRNTLIGALIAVSIALVLGTSTGLVAGYFGKSFDSASSWVSNAIMALPAMIVLLALFQTLGGSVSASMAVFGVMLAPGYFRLTRNQVIAVRHELYVDAARVSGLSDARIIARHILRVVRSPIIIDTSIVAGIAIMIQSGLEFLGLGDQNTPTWGGMLQDAFSNIYVAPLTVVWPGLMISLTVAALVLFANAVRDALQGGRTDGAPSSSKTPTPLRAAVDGDPAVLLSVRGLSVAYGSAEEPTVVVEDVGFDIRDGEIVGVVGESGSGKTQTAFSILGLLPRGGRVVAGSILFEGTQLAGADRSAFRGLRGTGIAYVPQEPMSNLDPAFRIGFQLVEPMVAVLGISNREAERRALALLARVGIADPKRTFAAYPHEISGGMAQRVLIAGAVSCNPRLLIADEPTTALDVTVQADVLDLLRDLQQESGMGVMLVTHNLGVVADLCDRVVVMRRGCVVEQGPVHDIFRQPRHPYTRMLLESTLDGVEARGELVSDAKEN
ncbi:peptide/nickel transport system permease protein [Agromyces sp. 3263]|uniref:dipeptide/oligopeptide/nickel ABC transporter permease/ATP-binding protein n=1 Tax=Agromyces sp. 3263 TaxID=2817750 RepID=UPI002856B91B|nr:dipeptide/oligopeptide/nickel ABC transporter permease/ATP-binding protein [Agromyces sp. 3263]MDR6906631.1 peptide/nickel transport system permease protein [Agromyces sp. 3263]